MAAEPRSPAGDTPVKTPLSFSIASILSLAHNSANNNDKELKKSPLAPRAGDFNTLLVHQMQSVNDALLRFADFPPLSAFSYPSKPTPWYPWPSAAAAASGLTYQEMVEQATSSKSLRRDVV